MSLPASPPAGRAPRCGPVCCRCCSSSSHSSSGVSAVPAGSAIPTASPPFTQRFESERSPHRKCSLGSRQEAAAVAALAAQDNTTEAAPPCEEGRRAEEFVGEGFCSLEWPPLPLRPAPNAAGPRKSLRSSCSLCLQHTLSRKSRKFAPLTQSNVQGAHGSPPPTPPWLLPLLLLLPASTCCCSSTLSSCLCSRA